MEKAWTISIVGIIVALGGLGIIATFFAIVGHFFKRSSIKNSKKKSSPTTSSIPSTRSIKEPAPIPKSSSKSVNANAPSVTESGEDEEILAVIGAAIAAFEGQTPRIVSVNRVEEKHFRNIWRFHDAQRIWRINKRK